MSSMPGDYESALEKVFDEKEKSRRKLDKLWLESSILEEQVQRNKKEFEELQLKGKVNREKLLKATGDSVKLDQDLKTAVRSKVKSPVDINEKKRLEERIEKNRKRMAEGGKNLADHENELATMDSHGEDYEAKKQEVERYKEVQRKCVENLSAKISSMQARIQDMTPWCVKERSGSGVIEPTTSSSSRKQCSSSSRDDVIVIEEKRRKMAVKEREKIIPKVMKTEEEVEESYPAYSCSHCSRHLSSAAALMSHLENHFPVGALLHCPFPSCNFSSKVEGLTRHARSNHTGEKLFHCSMCTNKLPSYSALVAHEKKHNNLQMKQCETCLRFYKIDGPGCYNCWKMNKKN
eukprot:GFUD01134837.1.p1 GENE.GFUD01134837.1~~GFUD01134837.1.p1  ORF type:complete len:366 (-),score=96.56 GFUD01134837.1:168-1214(-)